MSGIGNQLHYTTGIVPTLGVGCHSATCYGFRRRNGHGVGFGGTTSRIRNHKLEGGIGDDGSIIRDTVHKRVSRNIVVVRSVWCSVNTHFVNIIIARSGITITDVHLDLSGRACTIQFLNGGRIGHYLWLDGRCYGIPTIIGIHYLNGVGTRGETVKADSCTQNSSVDTVAIWCQASCSIHREGGRRKVVIAKIGCCSIQG